METVLLKKTVWVVLIALFPAWVLCNACGRSMLNAQPLKKWVSPKTGMVFLRIPGGCYQMGEDTGYEYERPAHEVCVQDFYLGQYEVTQKQWESLMGTNPSRFKGPDHPVQRITWNDAQAYIAKLNALEETDLYRLPTEAEWERAARGGTTTRYYWGNEIDNDYAWYYGSSNFQSHPVGTAKPNPFGLYDMLGNVWEWVSDWYDFDYYKKSPRENPQGPETGTLKTRRGGSMANLASYVRSASRYRGKVDHPHYILGFRVARSISNTE